MELPLAHLRNRTRQLAEFVGRPNARENLDLIQSPARQMVVRAVLATPGLPEFLYTHVAFRPYTRLGYSVLGAGAHAVTLRDGNTSVKKLYPESVGLSEEDKLALLEKWKSRQELNLTHLAEYTVEQSFSIEEIGIPQFSGHSIITASQPIVEFDHSINATQLARGKVATVATQFVIDAENMYEATNQVAIPDVIGNCNLVIDRAQQRLLLIDTIALTIDDAEDAATFRKAAAIFDRNHVEV